MPRCTWPAAAPRASWLRGRRRTTAVPLYKITRAIGADDVWGKSDSQGRKITGKGVDVALIDSGVAPVEGLSGAGKVVNGPDLSFESQRPDDRATSTPSATARTWPASSPAATRRPAGDDARPAASSAWRPTRAPQRQGRPPPTAPPTSSQVIAAIDWVVQHRNDNGLNIRVLNLSFGTDSTQDYLLDPLAYAVEVAWRKRHRRRRLGRQRRPEHRPPLTNPAFDPYVIAVGASDTQGTDDRKRRRGRQPSPAPAASDTRRPDLVAPGRSIVSLRDPGSYIDVPRRGPRAGRLAPAASSGAAAPPRPPRWSPARPRCSCSSAPPSPRTR